MSLRISNILVLTIVGFAKLSLAPASPLQRRLNYPYFQFIWPPTPTNQPICECFFFSAAVYLTSVSARWSVPYDVEENLRGMNERMKERRKEGKNDTHSGFLILNSAVGHSYALA